MAKYVIYKDDGKAISVESKNVAEEAKLDNYNYSGGLKFVDVDDLEHNMNGDHIQDIVKQS